MSSPQPPPPTTTTRRPRRESRFTEGDIITSSDLHTQSPPTQNELFFTILSQMDEHEEKRRKRNNSNSSVESFVSSNGSPTSPQMSAPKETIARRSVTFGRRSGELVRKSLDERPRGESNGREALADKVKGRLRALTGERRKDVKPYPGT
jgi:hypothetical protein